MIGTEWGINPFYYKNSPDPDFNKLYKEVYMEQTSDDYKNIQNQQVYWSDDKKKIKIVWEDIFEGTNDMMNKANYKYSTIYSFVYDDSKKLSKMFYIHEQFQDDPVDNSNDFNHTNFYSITLKEDSSNANLDGVYIIYENVINDDLSNYSYKAEGYADDNGGYLESTYSYTDPMNNNIPVVWKYKEAFDGNGDETYFAWWENGTWTEDTDLSDDSYVSMYNDEWQEFESYDETMNDNSYVDDIYNTASGVTIITIDTTPDSFFLIYGDQLSPGALDYLNGENMSPTPEQEAEVAAVIGTAYSDEAGDKLYIYFYDQTDDTSVYLYVYDWQNTFKYYLAHDNVNIQP
ncbi:MAG TPA: hypothetical protein PLE45_02905 [Spirochaetota bacterium]|nr:hypothetical protein [Spirochaetota bacterium]HOL56656.1 hypothetical protein [Spirochaetota bacterium]HPP04195.1 hypothetical protein [Spirochaetota bacterium]